MRQREKQGPLSVHAIAGSYVVLLGINLDEGCQEGVLGFAIERIDHTNGDRRSWLQGFKTFPGSDLPPGALVSTREHPIQAFLWADFTTRLRHDYTYRVVAMRGEPGDLREGDSVEVRIRMEDEDQGRHAVYFNRGVAGSQAYARKFGNRRPDDVPNREAWRWLSRGLFKAILDFIGQADSPRHGLRVAAYEFKQGAVLGALARARDAGADVKVVFDARANKADTPRKENLEAIEMAGISEICIPRTKDPTAISHNKFIVLLEDGRPTQVLTGSTNFTQGGIFGHSNVGHIVRDPEVAARYLAYWEKLSTDPAMNRKPALDEIRPWNDQHTPTPKELPPPDSTTTIFSPRTTLDALEWYTQRMDATRSAVFFTAAFGVNDMFEAVLGQDKNYLRYVLLESEDTHMDKITMDEDTRVAVGNVLGENEFERWLAEKSSKELGLTNFVKFIHTKYMLIDPLGDDPLVISGSANFSDASTRRNDENMLVIRGDRRVADIYLGEFMRLFNHFYFRQVANSHHAEDGRASALEPDDTWCRPYFVKGSAKEKERLYFAG